MIDVFSFCAGTVFGIVCSVFGVMMIARELAKDPGPPNFKGYEGE